MSPAIHHMGASVACAQLLGPGMAPPPSTVNCSCVYIVRRNDGFFYVGESDDIKGLCHLHLEPCMTSAACMWC